MVSTQEVSSCLASPFTLLPCHVCVCLTTTRYICRNNASCYVEHFGRVWDAIQSTGRNMTFGMCAPQTVTSILISAVLKALTLCIAFAVDATCAHVLITICNHPYNSCAIVGGEGTSTVSRTHSRGRRRSASDMMTSLPFHLEWPKRFDSRCVSHPGSGRVLGAKHASNPE